MITIQTLRDSTAKASPDQWWHRTQLLDLPSVMSRRFPCLHLLAYPPSTCLKAGFRVEISMRQSLDGDKASEEQVGELSASIRMEHIKYCTCWKRGGVADISAAPDVLFHDSSAKSRLLANLSSTFFAAQLSLTKLPSILRRLSKDSQKREPDTHVALS